MTSRDTPVEVMKVWYSLNDVVDFVEIASDANIAELRDAIKAKWGDRLHCAAPELVVYEGTKCRNPRDKLSTLRLREEDTLVVVAPPPPQQPPNRKIHCVNCC